jgi:hypothetical protein
MRADAVPCGRPVTGLPLIVASTLLAAPSRSQSACPEKVLDCPCGTTPSKIIRPVTEAARTITQQLPRTAESCRRVSSFTGFLRWSRLLTPGFGAAPVLTRGFAVATELVVVARVPMTAVSLSENAASPIRLIAHKPAAKTSHSTWVEGIVARCYLRR